MKQRIREQSGRARTPGSAVRPPAKKPPRRAAAARALAGDLAGRVGISLLAGVAEFNSGRRSPALAAAWDTPLYGDGGPLDSLALVQLIVAVEQRLEDDLGVAIALADERALSQRRSPFRSLGALRDFVVSSLAGRKA